MRIRERRTQQVRILWLTEGQDVFGSFAVISS